MGSLITPTVNVLHSFYIVFFIYIKTLFLPNHNNGSVDCYKYAAKETLFFVL